MSKIQDHLVRLGTPVLTEAICQHVLEDTWNGRELLVRTSCTLATLLFKSWLTLPSMMVSEAEVIVETSSTKLMHMLVSTLDLTRLMVAKPSLTTQVLGILSNTTVQHSSYHNPTRTPRMSLLLLLSQVQVLVDLLLHQVVQVLILKHPQLLRSQLHLSLVWIPTTGLATTTSFPKFKRKQRRQMSLLSTNTNKSWRHFWK